VLLNVLYENDAANVNRLLLDYEIPKITQSELTKKLSEIKHIIPKGRFRVSVINQTSEVVDNQSLEKIFGILISDSIDSITVDLKNPEIIFYVIINPESLIIGLDFSGDMSKRDYRIFNSPMSIKGTTAYGLLKIVGFKNDEKLLDPHCNSGTIAIEASLYAGGISTKFYDKNMPFSRLKIFDETQLEAFFKRLDKKKISDINITAADPLLKNVTAAKKNAKIAGVEKIISFRRIDIDWMDIKHEKKHFDKIVTFIPGSSKHRAEKLLEKEFTELFYQAEYILEDDGLMAVLCLSKDLLINASKQYFSLTKEYAFYSGEQLMTVLLFKKILKKTKKAWSE
jgi:23S rRNA G2445 N2-methylase RlmL